MRATLLAITLAAALTSLAAAADRLLLPIDLGADPAAQALVDADPMAGHPAVLRRSAVRIDRDALTAIDPAVGSRIELDLHPGVRVTAIVERMESVSPGHNVYLGRLARVPFGRFSIAVSDEVVLANVVAPTLGSHQLRWLGDGVAVVREVVEQKLGDCGCGVVAMPAPPASAGDGGVASEGGVADSGDLIDVLVVYTENARAEQGGLAAMQALIATAIAETNQAYADSDILPRLRLVGWKQTSFDDSVFESGEILGHLTDPESGQLDAVHDWRDEAGADLVALIVSDQMEDADAICGLAWLPSSATFAFSLTRANCATAPGLTFAHEIGHNMGCNHDHAEGGSGGTAPWAFGHPFTGDTGSWRTIMVRQSQPGTRVLQFSNPDIDFDGAATGVGIGLPNAAHNAQVHNERAGIVANFRQGLPGEVWVDFVGCNPLLQFGTQGFPYCTLGQGIANVVWGGDLRIKAGSSGPIQSVTITKGMRIIPVGGSVTIGQ